MCWSIMIWCISQMLKYMCLISIYILTLLSMFEIIKILMCLIIRGQSQLRLWKHESLYFLLTVQVDLQTIRSKSNVVPVITDS